MAKPTDEFSRLQSLQQLILDAAGEGIYGIDKDASMLCIRRSSAPSNCQP